MQYHHCVCMTTGGEKTKIAFTHVHFRCVYQWEYQWWWWRTALIVEHMMGGHTQKGGQRGMWEWGAVAVSMRFCVALLFPANPSLLFRLYSAVHRWVATDVEHFIALWMGSVEMLPADWSCPWSKQIFHGEELNCGIPHVLLNTVCPFSLHVISGTFTLFWLIFTAPRFEYMNKHRLFQLSGFVNPLSRVAVHFMHFAWVKSFNHLRSQFYVSV